MNNGLETAISSTSVEIAEESAPNDDAVLVNYKHPRRPLAQKKRRPARSFVTDRSERKPRQGKTGTDERTRGVESEGSPELESDSLDTLLPSRSSPHFSRATTSSRQSFETLRLARYGAGPRNDPFSAYPIPANGSVPYAVDVCKNNPVLGTVCLNLSAAELTGIESSSPDMGTAAGTTAPEIDNRKSDGLAIIPSSLAERRLL
jgi:hypothetical protein